MTECEKDAYIEQLRGEVSKWHKHRLELAEKFKEGA